MGRLLALAAFGCLASCSGTDGMVACQVGTRGCAGNNAVECGPVDGGILLHAALCPTSSTCVSGACQPPAGAKICAKEGDCPGQTCTGFVDPTSGGIGTFCAGAEGNTSGGLPCTTAAQCRSNLCLAVGANGRLGCFLACQQDGDCSSTPSIPKCRTFSVTITGVQGTIQGCGSP